MYAKELKKLVVRFWEGMFRLTRQGRRLRLCARTRASQLHGLDTGGSTVLWLSVWQAAP